jgi:signal recognition particle subunit SRP54
LALGADIVIHSATKFIDGQGRCLGGVVAGRAEREDPSIINPKRKRRIAAGSGTQVSDVNKLLKQFEMMQKMMKQFKKSPKGFARRLGGMMGNPNAFRGLK